MHPAPYTPKACKKDLIFLPWNKQCTKNYIYFSDCSKFIVAVKYLYKLTDTSRPVKELLKWLSLNDRLVAILQWQSIITFCHKIWLDHHVVKISVKPDSLKYADEVVASVNYKHRNTNKKRFMHVNFDSEGVHWIRPYVISDSWRNVKFSFYVTSYKANIWKEVSITVYKKPFRVFSIHPFVILSDSL